MHLLNDCGDDDECCCITHYIRRHRLDAGSSRQSVIRRACWVRVCACVV